MLRKTRKVSILVECKTAVHTRILEYVSRLELPTCICRILDIDDTLYSEEDGCELYFSSTC